MRLPEFLTRLSPVGKVVDAMERGASALEAEAQHRNAQVTVSAATDGLSLWEKDYGLSSGGDLTARRSRICAAMAGQQTLTRKQLERLAFFAGGAAGDAEEDFSRYTATLYVLYDAAVTEALPALEEVVKRLQPAHLTVAVCPALGCWDTRPRSLAPTGTVYQEFCSKEGEEA